MYVFFISMEVFNILFILEIRFLSDLSNFTLNKKCSRDDEYKIWRKRSTCIQCLCRRGPLVTFHWNQCECMGKNPFRVGPFRFFIESCICSYFISRKAFDPSLKGSFSFHCNTNYLSVRAFPEGCLQHIRTYCNFYCKIDKYIFKY